MNTQRGCEYYLGGEYHFCANIAHGGGLNDKVGQIGKAREGGFVVIQGKSKVGLKKYAQKWS